MDRCHVGHSCEQFSIGLLHWVLPVVKRHKVGVRTESGRSFEPPTKGSGNLVRHKTNKQMNNQTKFRERQIDGSLPDTMYLCDWNILMFFSLDYRTRVLHPHLPWSFDVYIRCESNPWPHRLIRNHSVNIPGDSHNYKNLNWNSVNLSLSPRHLHSR